jgi:predicted PurR-regulated permease PerM
LFTLALLGALYMARTVVLPVLVSLLLAPVGGVLWLLGMPSPMRWGAMAGLLNFIPYMGAMAGVVIVALLER